MKLTTAVCLLSLCSAQFAQSAIVDVFIATGQSNAWWGENPDGSGQYLFGLGVQSQLTASGLFSNPTVVLQAAPGRKLSTWFDTGPEINYDVQFFNSGGSSPDPLPASFTGSLETQINTIIANGDTPVFRGLFWFQGESDALFDSLGDDELSQYTTRWNGLLDRLNSDLEAAGVSSTNYNVVMNTVAIGDGTQNWGSEINNILTDITDADPGSVLFDTQVSPYRTDLSDVHGYNHNAVGQANAQLFINSFVSVPEPSRAVLLSIALGTLLLRRRRG